MSDMRRREFITLLGGRSPDGDARTAVSQAKVDHDQRYRYFGTLSRVHRRIDGVLAENAVGPARRGRLARARAAVKKHPNYSESGYFLAVETAFKNWEAMQNIGR
jgi:hypothetical protein